MSETLVACNHVTISAGAGDRSDLEAPLARNGSSCPASTTSVRRTQLSAAEHHAEVPEGIDEHAVRTVTNNADALKLDKYEFE